MKEPKISVLMGTYYQSSDLTLLRRSVVSILAQDEPSFELLICDDGSTPSAMSLLNELAETDSRIRLLRVGNRFTLPEKLNTCLERARGNYIARMDDDDFSHSDRFSKQLAFLRAHQEVAFVGCCASLHRNNVEIGKRSLPEYPEVRDFLFVQPFIHPTLLFRREVLLAVNGYSENRCCLLCEDYDLLLRLYETGFLGANLPECLLDYTLSATARGSRTMRHRWNEAVTRHSHFRTLGLLPRAWPYVIKPLAVGLIPEQFLQGLKQHFYERR